MKNTSLVTRHSSLSQGFSMIELMFAVIFMVIIILGVMQLQTSNLVLSKTNTNEADAYFWANQAVEIVETLGPAAVNPACTTTCTKFLAGGGGSPYILQDTAPSPSLTPAPFRLRLIFDPTDLTNAYKVTSRIDWPDSSGEHFVEVKRVVFN